MHAHVVENGRYFAPFSTVQRNGIGGVQTSNLQIRRNPIPPSFKLGHFASRTPTSESVVVNWTLVATHFVCFESGRLSGFFTET